MPGTYYNPGDPRNTPGYDPYAPSNPGGAAPGGGTGGAGGPQAPVGGFEGLLGGYISDAQRIGYIEDTNRQRGIGLLQQEFDRGTPLLGDADIQRMFGSSANRINADTQAMARRVRANTGASGVYGGVPAGVHAQVQLGRLGQLAEQRGNLKTFQTQFNAQQAMNRWGKATTLAGAVAAPPSTYAHDALGDVIGAQLTERGIQAQERASKRSSKDSKFGAILGLGASLLGAF